jgi:hypothetical protein
MVFMVFAAVPTAHLRAQPLPESNQDTIGYSTVDEAMTALRMRPDVEISEQQGWIVVADRKNYTFWSFAPKTNPAYPAAVKRRIVQEGDDLKIQMDVLCQAAKEPCDALVRDFQAMNERLRQFTRSRAATPNR